MASSPKTTLNCRIRQDIYMVAKKMGINRSKALEEKLIEIIGPRNLAFEIMELKKREAELAESQFMKETGKNVK